MDIVAGKESPSVKATSCPCETSNKKLDQKRREKKKGGGEERRTKKEKRGGEQEKEVSTRIKVVNCNSSHGGERTRKSQICDDVVLIFESTPV